MRRVAIWLVAVLVGTFSLLPRALADQSVASGSGRLSASASIDFKIVIPRVMGLRVDAAATAAHASGPSHLLGARATSMPDGVQGAQLRSNMRAVTLSRDSGSPAYLTAASP
jgi:hypothetical protein